MPTTTFPSEMSETQALDAAAADANANAGSGNVGDAALPCPAANTTQDTRTINTTIKIRLYDVYHKPMGGAAYTLAVDGNTYEGKTGGDGIVSQVLPGRPTSGTLTLDMWAFELTINPLTALDDPDGYAARLDNLGYFAADPSMALMRFQSANGLNLTGQMNDETKAKLEEAHGY